MSEYKMGFVLVMEDGQLLTWVGMAEDLRHAEGLAIAWASHKVDMAVWDMASLPMNEGVELTV